MRIIAPSSGTQAPFLHRQRMLLFFMNGEGTVAKKKNVQHAAVLLSQNRAKQRRLPHLDRAIVTWRRT